MVARMRRLYRWRSCSCTNLPCERLGATIRCSGREREDPGQPTASLEFGPARDFFLAADKPRNDAQELEWKMKHRRGKIPGPEHLASFIDVFEQGQVSRPVNVKFLVDVLG